MSPDLSTPSARTIAEGAYTPGPNGTRQVGHRYRWLNQLVDADSAVVERGAERIPASATLSVVAPKVVDLPVLIR